MISKSTLDQLATHYPTSSWAVWSDRFPRRDSIEASDAPQELVDFIRGRAAELRPELILLGFNPSTEKPGEFSNFHSTKPWHQDAWLRIFIEEAGLEGAYMTDLSETVARQIDDVETPDDPRRALVEQLVLLDQDRYQIVCWGRAAFAEIHSSGKTNYGEIGPGKSVWQSIVTLGNIEPTLYSVYHYSQVDASNLETLRNQLNHLSRIELD